MLCPLVEPWYSATASLTLGEQEPSDSCHLAAYDQKHRGVLRDIVDIHRHHFADAKAHSQHNQENA